MATFESKFNIGDIVTCKGAFKPHEAKVVSILFTSSGVVYEIFEKDYSYKVKEEFLEIATIPDSIEWSHVHPDFKYMVRVKQGGVWLLTDKPTLDGSVWELEDSCRYCYGAVFNSYKQGTVDWKDSLVQRPEGI